jgi:hypothetical protein
MALPAGIGNRDSGIRKGRGQLSDSTLTRRREPARFHETQARPGHADYILCMDRIIRVFRSHEEAARADRAELAAMSPQERLDRALALQAHYREAFGDAGQGLARVARIVPIQGS